MEHNAATVRELRPVEHVRCLDCGSSYAKPAGGGTVKENPGCPRCGYLGWIIEAPGSRRSGAGQPPSHAARSR